MNGTEDGRLLWAVERPEVSLTGVVYVAIPNKKLSK